MMDKLDLENRFTYHPPPDQRTGEKYVSIRQKAHEFAQLINVLVPDSREKSLAIINLEETVMWANAGIARNP